MYQRFNFFLFFLFAFFSGFAQIGGNTTYSFLRLPYSARAAALGEANITALDNDLSLQLSNPALLNPQMDKQFMISQVIYPGGINYGNLAYAKSYSKLHATFGAGLGYIAYGNFDKTNTEAEVTGHFSAGELAAYLGGSYQFGQLFSAGANFKFIYSGLANFHSVGMALDMGASIHDKKKIFTASLVAKNVGGQLKPYRQGNREPIAFDLQAGFGLTIPGAPLTIHYTMHDLHRWNIRYDNPADAQTDNLFQDSSTTKSKSHIGDELLRHMIFGVELNIKKIVFIDIAYNHQRRVEIKQDTRRSLAGITFGLGIQVKPVRFQVAIVPMPLKQTLAHFTLNLDTGSLKKKKK